MKNFLCLLVMIVASVVLTGCKFGVHAAFINGHPEANGGSAPQDATGYCKEWGLPYREGLLNRGITSASDLAHSRVTTDTGHFYVANLPGSQWGNAPFNSGAFRGIYWASLNSDDAVLLTLEWHGATPVDVGAMTTAPCYDNHDNSCLYIWDADESVTTPSLIVFQEPALADFPSLGDGKTVLNFKTRIPIKPASSTTLTSGAELTAAPGCQAIFATAYSLVDTALWVGNYLGCGATKVAKKLHLSGNDTAATLDSAYLFKVTLDDINRLAQTKATYTIPGIDAGVVSI